MLSNARAYNKRDSRRLSQVADLELHVVFRDRVLKVHGDEQNNRTIGTPVQGGMALWGATPAALYARTPRAWDLVSRRCGEMRMAPGRDANEICLQAFDLPPVCRHQEGILRMWEGGFCGQAEFVGHTALVETEAPDFAQTGNARFVIRFQKGKDQH